jgi:ribosomal protein L12E/L44/L45/RPP1/RPP2
MSKDKKPKTPDLITGEEEAKLKELIKSLIKQELEEMTGTGAVAGFSTPFAFSKKGGTNNATKATLKQNPGSKVAKEIDEEEELDEKKDHKKKKKPDADGDGVPDWADKHPGEPDQNFEKKAKKKAVWKKGVEKLQKDLDSLDENEKKLNEAVSRYARLKENPKRHSYKVSLITQEITKMLREVDFLMSVNQRLKTEMNVPNEELWKRTSGRIAEIKARLKSIGMKLRKLQ